MLGSDFAAVILDLHTTLRPDRTAAAHGLVRRGGALILRLPPDGRPPANHGERLTAPPHDPDDVDTRLWQRLLDKLSNIAATHDTTAPPDSTQHNELSAQTIDHGTREQRRLAARLHQRLATPRRTLSVVTGRRGRGKSTALGLAIRRLLQHDRPPKAPPLDIRVTARRRSSTHTLLKYATGRPQPDPLDGLRFDRVGQLLRTTDNADSPPDIIVIDEAAQLPIHVLQRLVRLHRHTTFVFATTIDGYEGTGRGFLVEFVPWLDRQSTDLQRFRLHQPIRWRPDDELESTIEDALLFDATPADLDPVPRALSFIDIDRDQLADHESRLRQLYGLLRHAHYRTTPADLHRLLDAPNVALHGILEGDDLVAVTWIAHEGCLDDDTIDDLLAGRRRLRGHALPEQLVERMAADRAGRAHIIRHIRTAVHPDRRRRGLATQLIDYVHSTYSPDLFGTIFSARPYAVAFRQSVGHRTVRLGASPGRTAGVPSVTMLRPASNLGADITQTLRTEFQQNLPIRVDLMRANDDFPVDPELTDILHSTVPDDPPSVPHDRLKRRLHHFAHGPPTYESAAFAIEWFVRRHPHALDELPDPDHQLIRARVLQRCSWQTTTHLAKFDSIRTAMRRLRPAIRQLIDLTDHPP